jgi:hypothetical protein
VKPKSTFFASRRPPPALVLAVAVLIGVVVLARLVLAAPAPAQSPVAGGTVPSTVALSLSEPSHFRRIGRSDFFGATIRARATATDVPTKLSVVDGEVSGGRRLGHMASRNSILSPALEVTAGRGLSPFHSLDATLPTPLRIWRQPLSSESARIRLRQKAPSARALRNHGKLLLVTLTVGGP